MGRTCKESNTLPSPKTSSVVFESLWVKKDTTFRLNHSLLGNNFLHKGNVNLITGIEDKQRRPITFTTDTLKKKFDINTSLESQNSDSNIQDPSKKNENLRFVPGSAPSRELLSSKDEPLDAYVLVLAQEHEAESSNQNGTYEGKSTGCSVSSSAQNRQPEFSNQDATRGKNLSNCYCSGSKHSCLLESSSENEALGKIDHCFIPSSNRTISNASTDSCHTDFIEEGWFDSRMPSSFSSSEWERPRRKKTRMERSKESRKRPPKTPKLKVHQCDFCPKRFALRFARDIHRRIHTGERPFECRSCSMTFTSDSSLKKHYKIHQPVLLKTCKTCGKRFRCNNSLKDHAKVHMEWSGPHLCESCGSEFSRKVFLDRHLLNCTKQ